MDKLKNIKGVFLDLGGTLLFPPSGSWTFSDFARKYFSEEKMNAIPKERLDKILWDANAELEKNHLLHSFEEEYQKFFAYYTQIAVALPELGVTEEQIHKVVKDKLYNKPGNYRLFDDTIDTLKALRGTYKLGIISDTWPSIVPALEESGILDYMDCVTYSFEQGVFKPHPKMYQDALSKMGLPPEQTVFVDDLPKNLEGARAHGIHPVLIRAIPASEPREDMHNIDKISGLLEILE
ncbi:HAD family hydrolase [Acutalibacter sp. 1XD8-33]|uniref:HAD family hydrolase n=1 Tax=Acutalibacter sp. 1XD8-33 TaxID=2320081 RepID=UPI00131443FF|nr:HAD-IA family hydrolase [Acutalibacter sp. 1XD8-33]